MFNNNRNMMKNILLIGGFLFLGLQNMSALAPSKKAVEGVIERTVGHLPANVKWSIHPDRARGTYFRYEAKDGKLFLKGSDPVAVCHGFYDYIKKQHLGLYTWSGNNIRLPERLPAATETETVSPFKNHYYFNVVTFGYSMPYWDWNRWQKEIDWMALHGMNMPLALNAYEAIIARVWKKMGLTDDEINGYFVGPAHLPWMRMGNISGIDGPLNADWHASQIALEHKILNRMKSLGMKPICPGFAGFIPKAFQRIYPNLHIITTHWGEGHFNNWMISPQEPLFKEIEKAFIEEWEKEFGAQEYYLVDSFNEMDIPFPEKGNKERYEMAADYGKKVYEGIHAANPKAVWVMQGWMFGYQRNIWDQPTLEALISKVPNDKMLLLDLAADYNKYIWDSAFDWDFYKGFFGKQWVYSVIPNMGGKTGMTGVLEFYANGHLNALQSAHKGELVAFGFAPEGIENNEVIYELLSDAGWSSHHLDLRQWLRDYSICRYGAYPSSLERFWDGMLKSVYGSFTDHPRFRWQFRPGRQKKGSIMFNDAYFKGLKAFAEAADSLPHSSFFQNDLAEITAQYLGGKAELLTYQIDSAFVHRDTLQAALLEKQFETALTGIDAALSHHPTLRLDRWVDFASKAAKTPAQRKQYETNARRLVTIWGPPVDDYSARIWNGLVGRYYLKRWEMYFDSRVTGKAVDWQTWERNWVEKDKNPHFSPVQTDIVILARKMMQTY